MVTVTLDGKRYELVELAKNSALVDPQTDLLKGPVK